LIESRDISVLLVEDDDDDYVLTRDLLADSRRTRFTLDWVSTYEDGIRAIHEARHDVYLVDYRLGEHDGLEILRQAREGGCARPIILLTGQGDGEVDIAAMNAGAADYLVKGQIDAQILERSIRYSLEQNRTLEALRESEERYAHSARGANDGLWVWDLAAGTVYYSERWKEMLGYSTEEIGDSPDEWFSRVHPDDMAMLLTEIDAHRNNATPSIEHEHRVRHKNGGDRWMLARGVAIRANEGDATRIAGSLTDITARKIAIDRLTYDAFHDGLTGLPNRALFMDRLGSLMERSQRLAGYEFAVLFVDLDRFKIVNDSLGHAVGDQLLIGVGERLRAGLRPTDTVARLGGDEFTILLETQHLADAIRAAERLQAALRVPFNLGDHEIFTTASVGIALSATGYERPQDVVRDADIAMYRAKSRGRGVHEVFDKTMHERAVKLLSFETDLRRAVERDELRVFYQPIVSLESQRVTGFEALLRWQRGDVLIAADEIVPIAEETGLILAIGEWVLREALRQLREWQERYPDNESLHMHVNLSPKQFLQPNLLELVAAALAEAGVDPRRLHLEVTESVVVDNADAAAMLLAHLRLSGVGISLDDFGTGYSSLSSLRQFPFDTLKIDRSFISGNADRRDDEIVRTISALARILGMEVTVEGLETADQIQRMRDLGIHYAQGFYFSPPVDAERALEFVTSAQQ